MNKIIPVLIVFSLVFVFGCTTGPGNQGSEKVFLGGANGLSIEFKELEPRLTFEKGELIDYTLLLRNSGEHDISKGLIKVKLDGVNFDDWENLNGDYKLVSSGVNGVSKDFPEPIELEVPLGKTKYVGDILGARRVTFGSKVCYPYITSADIDVCVSSQRLRDAGETACDIDGEKITSGSVSAGPVQITSVKESFLGSDSVKIDITLANGGNGQILDENVACESSDVGDTGVVNVRLPSQYKCTFPDGSQSNVGELRIPTGTKILRCEVETTNSYTDQLIMEVSYKYVDSGSVTVEVNPIA